MKPSYIVNIILYIHLSLSFSHSASRSLTHSLKHTFTLMLTIFFNLSAQLLVSQCKCVDSINKNLNGSCDQFFDHVPTKFIFNANHLLLFFIRNMIVAVTKTNSRNPATKSQWNIDTYQYLGNSPPREAEESNSPFWFHFTEAGYSIAYFNHKYISSASVYTGSRFTFDKISW